jgi:hypothetical protein
MHGILVDEKEISRIAGTHWWNGTDEIQLGKAARAYNCDLLMIRKHNAEKARRELVSYLRSGIPSLLCIYEWSHWVVVVKEEKGKFILLDSKDPAVLTILSWTALRKAWVYHEQDEYDKDTVRTMYDFHPVIPRFRVHTRANVSLARAKYLRRRSNRAFARLWDDYLEDLLAICKARTPLSENVFSLGEFLRRHEGMILDQVEFWHGAVNRRAARKILQNMHLVGDTYGLVIHEEDEKKAIAGIASLLMLWAAGEYGVERIYHTAPSRRRRPQSS